MPWKSDANLTDAPASVGRDAPASTAWIRNPPLEDLRKSMLSYLEGHCSAEVARMGIRLRYAADLEALWYLRADWFDILATLNGKAEAHQALAAITQMFQGLLPLSLRTDTH